MARPKGLAGILGSALIAVLCAADLFQLVWKFRAVRWVFEALNLGGAVDFIIQHTNNPGWVGNMLTPLGDPIVQIFLIALGLALIYFDNRRRTGNSLSYPVIGMAVSAVAFAAFFIAWIWLPAPTKTVQSKPLLWVFSGMAGTQDANGIYKVNNIQFLAAKNETGMAIRLVDAYIQSGIDSGKKMPLLLNTYEHRLIQLNDANPIPANTENITLIAEFPQLSENDFMKNWGTIDFVIQDEEQTFKGRIEDKTLIDVFAGYHLKTPPPRITKAPAPPIASPDKTKNEQGSASQQPVVSGDDNVVSFNQSGGQTARTIINNGPPPPELRGVYQGHRRNQDGTWNVVVMAQVVSAYPPGMLNLQIAAPNLLNVDIIGQDVSMTMFGPHGMREGRYEAQIMHPVGRYMITVRTSQPTGARYIQFDYDWGNQQ